MTKDTFLLGIDGGGTKCHAKLQNVQGEVLAECRTGPANPAQDAPGALGQILLACDMLCKQAGLTEKVWQSTSAVLGLAGVNIPKYHRIAECWPLPFARCTVTSDLHIACLAAHNGDDGAIMITGTGSSAFLSHNQQTKMLGGHGFPLGDKASGAWLGWRALSLTLETFDKVHPDNDLARGICAYLQVATAEELVALTLKYRPADYAQLAPLIFAHAAHCSFSRSIILEGAAYIEHLARHLVSGTALRFALIGGLADSWIPWLNPDVVNVLVPVRAEPVTGALLLAAR